MLEGLTPNRATAAWRVLPQFENLSVPEVARLRASVSVLERDLDTALLSAMDGNLGGASAFSVDTGLPVLLADMDRSLTVTRSSVLALLIQLAILAGYALVLSAGLLTDTRRTETILLRSRGTSPAQVLMSSVLEGLLITVPAALAGPMLATLLLRILNSYGPLASIGLRIEPEVTAEAYILALIAACLSVVALSWPAYRSARSFPESARRRRRQQTRTGTQRLGVDLALLALTVVVIWQLQILGPQISARVRGQFGVDPLLVVAPALGLLTGAVLALRIIPMLARAAEWVAGSRRSVVAALASWQVARRPARYARSSLLLIMAVSIGFFAASYSTTWVASQREQAHHAVGADIALVPNRSASVSLTDLHLADAHGSIPGIDSSMPVQRLRGQLSSTGEPAQFVLLDAAKAADIVGLRSDLATEFPAFMEDLVTARPEVASVGLPGEPEALLLRFEAVEELPEEEDLQQCGSRSGETCFDARVRVILQDGAGLLHRVDAGELIENVGAFQLEVDLTAAPTGGRAPNPHYPLSVVNIEVQSQLAEFSSSVVGLRLMEMSARQPSGAEEPVALVRGDWVLETSLVVGAFTRPEFGFDPTAPPDALAFEIETGSGYGVAPAYFSIRPAGTVLPDTFPVVVSDGFPKTFFAGVGEEINLPPLRISDSEASITGTIATFPTVDPALGEFVVADLATIQMMSYEPGFGLANVDSYWLATGEGETAAIAALRSPPLSSMQVSSSQELTDSLVSDPVALGTIGALTVGFVAAAMFAAVGFAVSATVSARERLIEFALLRALGLSRRQLGAWLIVEQGVLVVMSLALGTLVGIVLTAVILPLIALTQDGRAAVPDVIVIYPWRAVLGLELAVVSVLGAIVAVLTALLRRIGLGSLLRLGDDS
jgi:ABC-type lipoprotein release transport system permease subunit